MVRRRYVFLVGFMGAGKTTVGKILAQRLGWKFYDLDQLIENREKESIAGIFAKAGENAFRQIEKGVLMDLLDRGLSVSGAVIALGGGAFVQPENRRALAKVNGVTVLLHAPLEELGRRCRAADARPLAADKKKFEQLFASRQATYALADFRVETAGKRIQQIAEEIEQILEHK